MDGLGRPAPLRRWQAGAIEYDERGGTLAVGGTARAIEPIPRRLLHRLLRAGGDTLSKETLIDAGWSSTRALSDASFYNAVKRLRATLGEEGRDLIALEPGRGYRIAVPVTAAPSPAPPRPTLTLAAGDLVPGRAQWRLLEPLGDGQRRRTWRATHDVTGETRIFRFAEDAAARDSLRRELRAAQRLRECVPEEDGVVPVLEAALDSQPAWIEMDDGGQDLEGWAVAQGGLVAVPIDRRLALLARAAGIVGAAHELGVLHGGLSAEKILVEEVGASLQVRLVGFGADPGPDRPGHPCTAPELRAGGPPTLAADVHALAVLLYQLAAGDLGRPLAPGWEGDVADPLLRTDVAEAANGDPTHRLLSAAALAERLRSLDRRREDARIQAEAAREAAAQQDAAREAARQAVHAASLARRTRAAALVLLALLVLASGLAAVAWQKQRVAVAERRRATETARVLEGTVAGLIDTLTRTMRDRAGVTLAVRDELLGQAERALAEMARLAPQAATERLQARALAEFADLYRHEGDAERAAQAAGRAVGMQLGLLRGQPEDDGLRGDLAQSRRRLGDALLDARRFAPALAAYRESLDALRQLAARHPDDDGLWRLVAEGEGALGRALDESGDAAGAWAAYRERLAIATRRLGRRPDDAEWLETLSAGQIQMCDALESLGKPRDALAACQAGLATMQRLYERDPANTRRQRDVAVAWEDVGDEQEKLGDLPASLAAYRQAAALKGALAAADPGNMKWQEGLAIVDADLGDVESKLGDFAGAIASYRLSLSIADRLLAESPQSVSVRRMIAEYENNFALDLSKSGDAVAARPHVDRALATITRLLAEHPDDATLKQVMDETRDTDRQVRRVTLSAVGGPQR